MKFKFKLMLAILLVGIVSWSFLPSKPKPDTKKMNILFITVEDWTPNAIGCYGNKIVKTPNVDQLAKKGILFNRAYCQGAVCNPSRASITTGLRPDATKVYGNDDHPDDLITAEHPSMAGMLRTKGWTAQTGKLMHKWRGSFNVINDFDQIEFEKPFLSETGDKIIDLEPERGPFKGVTKYKDIIPDLLTPVAPRDWVWVPNKGHDTTLVRLQKERDAKLAAGMPNTWDLRKPFQQYHSEMMGKMGIEEPYSQDGLVTLMGEKMMGDFAKENKQFFLHIGLYAPHTPILAPDKFVDLYDTAKISISNITRDKDQGVPNIAVRNGNNYDMFNGMYPQFSPTPSNQKVAIASYYAQSSYVDAEVGRLLANLKKNKLDKNTIVVLTADHGFHLGEHGCWSKFTVFEESIRVPFIVYVPGAEGNGKKSDEIVELIDMLPTFCDLWGVEKDKRFEGTSFLPLLKNPNQPWKKAAFSMAPKPLNARTVRTKQYRYAEYLNSMAFPDPKPAVAIELYDHATDPHEQINLAGKPEYAKVEAEMKKMLYDGWKSALPDSQKQ